MKKRLQKLLSEAGVCSRRSAEEYIKSGRVKVNGIPAALGDGADPELDEITLDGAPLRPAPQWIYIMLNKPRGYVTTLSDEAGRRTVADLIRDVPQRVYPVGRLDMHSEGLLLLTNDGQLAHHLMHPSHEVYKQYLVKLSPDEPGLPSPEEALSRPIELDGQRLLPARCRLLAQVAAVQAQTRIKQHVPAAGAAFRVLAPATAQRAAFQEHHGTNSGAVVGRVTLNIEDHVFRLSSCI